MFSPPIASMVWEALEVLRSGARNMWATLDMPHIVNMIPLGVPWHEKWIGRMWNRMIGTHPFKHRTHHLISLLLKKAIPHLNAPNGQRASAAVGSWLLIGLHMASF